MSSVMVEVAFDQTCVTDFLSMTVDGIISSAIERDRHTVFPYEFGPSTGKITLFLQPSSEVGCFCMWIGLDSTTVTTSMWADMDEAI